MLVIRILLGFSSLDVFIFFFVIFLRFLGLILLNYILFDLKGYKYLIIIGLMTMMVGGLNIILIYYKLK